MKTYKSDDLGCYYRYDAGALEYAPMLTDGSCSDNWGYVDEDIVGGEPVTFEGKDMTLSEVYRIVEGRLNERTTQ